MPDYRPYIPQMVEKLVREFHPQRIILFGSYARGDFREGSDVDFLVVVPDEEYPERRQRRDLSISMDLALDEFPGNKDVVVATPRELKAFGEIAGFIYFPALLEGKVLYEHR